MSFLKLHDNWREKQQNVQMYVQFHQQNTDFTYFQLMHLFTSMICKTDVSIETIVCLVFFIFNCL